jgi:hypothetical protein
MTTAADASHPPRKMIELCPGEVAGTRVVDAECAKAAGTNSAIRSPTMNGNSTLNERHATDRVFLLNRRLVHEFTS